MATLARLTSLSTQTLSLLLERQRLQTLSAGGNGSALHLPQITRNLNQLRAGVLELEEKEGSTEAVRLLRSQYERMRGMLGPEAEAAGIPRSVVVSPGMRMRCRLTVSRIAVCSRLRQRRRPSAHLRRHRRCRWRSRLCPRPLCIPHTTAILTTENSRHIPTIPRPGIPPRT